MADYRKVIGAGPASLLAWQILAPVVAAFLVLLFLAGFAARSYFEPVALERDLARAQRYAQVAATNLGDNFTPSKKPSLPADLRTEDVKDLEFLPRDRMPDWPSPRYAASGPFADAWAPVRSPEGEVLGAVSLRRHARAVALISTAIQSFAAAACIAFALLALLGWALLQRRVCDRLAVLTHRVAPATFHAAGGEDAVNLLQAAVSHALAQAENREAAMRRILDRHSEMVSRETPEGTLLEVNDAYCRFFGLSREKLIGTNYLDLVPPPDRADAVASSRSVSSANHESTVELRLLLPDGQTRWTRWRDTAVIAQDGTVESILSYGTDITAEKEFAQRAKELLFAFNQMQSLAETGSLTWDFRHDFMQWTEETRRLLNRKGQTPASLATLIESVIPEDRAPLQQLFHRARENGNAFEHEFRVALPDGAVRILQSRAEVRADPKTKLLDLLTCTLRDITALRDAETATKRELRFREAVDECLAVGIVVRDMSGRAVSANPAFTRMSGFSEQELIDAIPPCEPYWPDEHRPAIEKAMTEVLEGHGAQQGYELVFCRKNGERFDVLVNVAALMDGNGRQTGWLGAVTDISAVQRTKKDLATAQVALREQLNYREYLDRSATVGLMAINGDGRILSVNDAFVRMLGYSEEEALPCAPPYPWWPPEERDRIQQAFIRHLDGKTPKEGFQLRFCKKNGERIDVLITAAPIVNTDGKEMGVLSAITDITAMQQATRSLAESNERLRIAQDVAAFGIWEWHPETDELFWDKNSFAIFGYPSATKPTEVWSSVHSEEEQERLTYELRRLIDSGGTSGEDRFTIRWPDGSMHDITSTYVILRDDAGHATRVIGVNRDITAELDGERAVREAGERLTALLEGVKFGTFEHVIGVGDINWSPTNYEINGIDPSVTDPAELFRLLTESTGDFFPQLMERIHAMPVATNHINYEFVAHPPGQKPRRIRSDVYIERNGHGHPSRLVGLTRRVD
jgi:PAS domain S-box-containing protein